MLAIAGGLGAAILFAASTLCSSRSARMIGPAPVLAWVMVVGLVAVTPALVATGPPDLDSESIALLALGGAGNVFGLLLTYAALRVGKVGIVASIVSTEGAIAAVLAVIAGEALSPGAGVTLALIAAGVALASRGGHAADSDRGAADRRRTVLLAVAGAAAFGASLYATGRVGVEVGAAWAVLPARVVGVVTIAVPLAAWSRLRLTRPAVPLVVTSGICEVLGFALFTLGAAHGIAVSSVLVSEFGAIAAIAAFVLFRERLARIQLAGVAVIVLGVGALSALQA